MRHAVAYTSIRSQSYILPTAHTTPATMLISGHVTMSEWRQLANFSSLPSHSIPDMNFVRVSPPNTFIWWTVNSGHRTMGEMIGLRDITRLSLVGTIWRTRSPVRSSVDFEAILSKHAFGYEGAIAVPAQWPTIRSTRFEFITSYTIADILQR